MFDDNGETFIATLYNVLLAPDLCDRLFSIITLMNSGHTCLFHKGFCTVYFGAKEDNAVTLPHSAVRKHAFMVKSKESSNKSVKKNLKKKIISSRPYAEAMAMRPAVTYTPYATSSKEQTGDVITFAQFEERNLLSNTDKMKKGLHRFFKAMSETSKRRRKKNGK